MDRRIAGYDLARSLALFWLVVVNFSVGVENADLEKADHGLFQWQVHHLIPVGATTVFLVLAGIGVSLLKQRDQITKDTRESTDSRKRLIKRAAFLLATGICLNLIWQEDVLRFYGISIAIGALLLTVSNRWLWSLVFVCVAIYVVCVFLFDCFLFHDYEIVGNLETLRNSDPWTAQGMLFRAFLNGFFFIFLWIAFLLIGMWLGRQDVRHPRTRWTVFFGGVVVALVAKCALWLGLFDIPQLPGKFSLLELDIENILLLLLLLAIDFFTNGGTAFAIIGGSLILAERYPDVKWTKPFIATGQLALTLYVVYLVIRMGLSKVLGVLEIYAYPFPTESAVIFCICAVIFSHFWKKRFERGPLEWAMRRITG